MKKYYYLFTLLFASASLFAQEFATLYQPHDPTESIVVRDVAVISDNSILAGFDLAGADNIPSAGLMKLDSDGNVTWANTLDIADSDAGCTFEVLEKADGNYYLWGLSKESVTANMRAILTEMTPDGVILWSKEYDFGWNVDYAYTVNKLYLLPSGEMQMMIAVFGRVIVMQTDAEGNIIWGKQSSIGPPDGGGKNPGFEWLSIPDDGGMCASKATNDLSILRYNADGYLMWTRRYEMGYTHGKTIKRSPNGNILIGGFRGFTPMVMEINEADGTVNWVKWFEGSLNMEYGSMAMINIIGDEIIFDYSNNVKEHIILRLDINGEVLETYKTTAPVFDYNKIEFTEDYSGYFYGSFMQEDEQKGMINKTDNILEGSCILELYEPCYVARPYDETFSDTPFAPTQTDFTSQEDIAVSMISETITTSDACSGSDLGIETEQLELISIYPNPSANMFTLNVTADLVQSNYVITDLAGKVVAKQLINSENELVDVSHLNNGHYLLTVFGEEMTITEKITVHK
ncbi:MAG: T9SS type A sorting domain-containing protein [Crocinitomix sp.]|nr:T9SS type A sorting domain-containing protein [Crocinitomix sp.]